MTKRHDVIIVGGGLAGIAAADILSGQGLRILVVDENFHTGGQLLRRPPGTQGIGTRFEPDPYKRLGMHLVKRLGPHNVDRLIGAQVVGIYPGHTLLVEARPQHLCEYRADTLILATGARERHLPFKGWTLPGVMATGAAQILMKTHGMFPGRMPVIGGLGPLMLVLAADILANGGKVRAILDQSPPALKLKALTAGPAIVPKLLEGALGLARLAAGRVAVRQGIRIIEARGRRQLESVVAVRTDADGRCIAGSERTYATDALAVGYGFSPNTELPQQAGCALSHDVDKGGWVVDVDSTMSTSVSGIYAAGEPTGIAGAGKSIVEGRIAAWDILYNLGRVTQQHHHRQVEPLIGQHRRQLRYGRFVNQLCRVDPGGYAQIPDETIICRCEEIRMGDVRQQLSRGLVSMDGMKRATRCTMGNCQGRTCGPILFDVLSAFSQRPPAAVGGISVRSPVKPVSLGALAKLSADNSQAPCSRRSDDN